MNIVPAPQSFEHIMKFKGNAFSGFIGECSCGQKIKHQSGGNLSWWGVLNRAAFHVGIGVEIGNADEPKDNGYHEFKFAVTVTE